MNLNRRGFQFESEEMFMNSAELLPRHHISHSRHLHVVRHTSVLYHEVCIIMALISLFCADILLSNYLLSNRSGKISQSLHNIRSLWLSLTKQLLSIDGHPSFSRPSHCSIFMKLCKDLSYDESVNCVKNVDNTAQLSLI